MRIAVLGAGAVGGTLAALLARAGHEVSVTARGEHLAAIRANGLRLEGGWGDYTAQVAAGDRLNSTPELAILATKAQDAAGALRDSASVLQGVPLVVVQNGLGGLRVAAEVLPDSPLFGGLALFAASYVSPGVVTVTGANPMIVGGGPSRRDRFAGAPQGAGRDRFAGAPQGARRDRSAGAPQGARRDRFAGAPQGAGLDAIVAVLRDALPIEVTPDFVGAQWTKLLINHVNALPAITGMSVQQVIADRGLRRVMTASMRETVRLARKLGVRFATVQGVSGGILNLIGVAPLWAGAAFPRLLARRMGEVPNPGSTLQSIRRGQVTEIEFLNGAVVAAAAERGLAAPVNAAIVALVHEVERTGTFLAPEEVLRRVRV